MANGAPESRRNGFVKRRSRAPLLVRLAGRVGATLVALLIFSLIGAQFARVIQQNVALARELSSTQADIVALHARRDWQVRQLRRLEDPEGSIPEIHERLRLVRQNEAIIFVSPLPSAAPSPAP